MLHTREEGKERDSIHQSEAEKRLPAGSEAHHDSKQRREDLFHSSDKNSAMPIFGSFAARHDIPRNHLNRAPLFSEIAYRLVADELLDEGVARQNLATFCQTYMPDEAVKLMSDNLDKNAIDKSEYPRTVELESRCVNIIANLWNAPKDESFLGTSTAGSSEASMLAGLAMKFRWRERIKEAGLSLEGRTPNMVISSGYQVCWEKFSVYWDVELRTVPMREDCMYLDPELLEGYLDENTIGVVGILGITYTGFYDDMAALDDKLSRYNQQARIPVPLHVDAASGGLFVPFVEPHLKWDFRLENVISINASGHKYGLVYPGIGWLLWRDQQYLPKELVFNVSYLGGEMPTMAINFSRSAAQIIGQYFNFVRYGFDGYRAIHKRTQAVASYLSRELEKTGLFRILNDGGRLPVVCCTLKEEADVRWTLYDLSDRLMMKGWQVPAYPLPAALDECIIHRYVIRADLSMNVAVTLVDDIHEAIEYLNKARVLDAREPHQRAYGFTH